MAAFIVFQASIRSFDSNGFMKDSANVATGDIALFKASRSAFKGLSFGGCGKLLPRQMPIRYVQSFLARQALFGMSLGRGRMR
jgi:hypothetical protein